MPGSVASGTHYICCTHDVHVQGQVMVGYISSPSKPART
jgi:hypothetical protein